MKGIFAYHPKRFNSRIIWQHDGVLRLLVEVTINSGFGKLVVVHEGLNGNNLSPTGLKLGGVNPRGRVGLKIVLAQADGSVYLQNLF